MQKQSVGKLSLRNACAIIVLIHISNTVVLGSSNGVGTDTWIAYLMALVWVVPFMLLYGRLVHLMPGRDLFEMMEFAFGKWATVPLSALYVFYFVTLSAIVRNYYAEFVHIVALINTPLLIILLSYFMVCAYLAKSGSETIGKWSSLILLISIVITVTLSVLSIPSYEGRHVLPLFSHSFSEIAIASMYFLPLPIGETVIVMSMIGGLEKKVNPYKLFLYAGGITVAFFAVMFLRNLAVLGEKMMETANFTSYKAASVIQVGSIGTRIESLVAVTFILTGITKVGASLYAGSKAVKSTFRLKDHNPVLLSVGLFSVSLSVILFYNVVEMNEFLASYRIYALPFQLAIPLALWIAAEIRVRAKGTPVVKGWKQADAGTGAQEPGRP